MRYTKIVGVELTLTNHDKINKAIDLARCFV